MDNARIYHAKLIMPLIEKLNFFYSAPYSPFLNPIEEFFGLLKHFIRKLACYGYNDILFYID